MQTSKNNKNRAKVAERKKVKASDKEEQFGGLRAALLRAALEQSSAMGPDSISFRELARRLGVTTAAPYYHFRDKAELLLQLAVEGFNKLLYRIEQATGKEQSAEKKMATVVQVFLAFGRRERGYYGIMFHREVVQPHNVSILEGPAAKCFDVVCSIIAEINPEWAKQEISERALASWSFLHGMLQLSASGPLARRLPPEHENQFALRVCRIILGME